MKKLLKFSILGLFALMSGEIYAQQPGDTIVVQSFDYSANTRDTMVVFPNDPNITYEKIIMQYNIRCKDNKVSNGSNRNQGCGEWDYSCNTYVHDSTHIDSLLTSFPNYIISGYSGSKFDYVTNPTRNYYQKIQKAVVIDSVISETASTVGTGTLKLDAVLPTVNYGGKSQYLFTKAELTSAGVTSGNINGITFKVNGATGKTDFFRVRLKNTSKTVLSDTDPDLLGLTEVYYHNTTFSTGTNKVQFYSPFNWNGTDNLLVEFSFTNKASAASIQIEGDSLSTQMGLATSGEVNFDFNGGNYIQLNYKGVIGTSRRTVEAWIKTTVTGKEIVSWGKNVNGKKWVVRLDGGGKLRIEVASGWIAGSTNVADGKWHHIAISFGGGNINQSKLYVDGVKENIGSAGSRIVNTGSVYSVRISRGIHNLIWDGEISEVRIFSDSLSQNVLQNWMYKEIDATHPNYSDISAIFPLNEGTGFSVTEATGKGIIGTVVNGGSWSNLEGLRHFKNIELTYKRPNLTFLQGTYNLTVSNDTIIDTVANNYYLVSQYQIYANAGQLKSDSVGKINTFNYWLAAPEVLYGPTGNIISSTPVTPDGTINITRLPYYRRTPAKFEIMSFVTPFGLGLSMGVNGKTWSFDVTDFAPIFKGAKRITVERGGQWQEDMDIIFLFIVGTPPREVKDIFQIWRVDYPSNAQIKNESFYEPRDLMTDASGKYFKIRSVITGHGQEGEFIPRTHYININGGSNEFAWKVDKVCGDNPIYPQGGTWIYDRAGWCPGMASDMQEFDITQYVTPGQTVNINYDMQTASGTSRYIINHQLVTYGAANFNTDVAVVDIISPSNKIVNNKLGSICQNPQVLIRNTGKTTLTSVTIKYWINNSATPQTYNWTGSLDFMKDEVVSIPAQGALWNDLSGTGTDVFNVEVTSPNGGTDEYALNNKTHTTFDIPDVLPSDFIIWFRTNRAAAENSYEIKDQWGSVVFSKSGFLNNTNYRDTVHLGSGCYTMVLHDNGGDGISFWANSDGNGAFRFARVTTGPILKVIEPDFGNSYTYNFTVDAPLSFEELHPSLETLVYPNPANNQFMVEMKDANKATITIVNNAGQIIELPKTVENNLVTFNSSALVKGVYYVRIETDKGIEMQKLVIM